MVSFDDETLRREQDREDWKEFKDTVKTVNEKMTEVCTLLKTYILPKTEEMDRTINGHNGTPGIRAIAMQNKDKIFDVKENIEKEIGTVSENLKEHKSTHWKFATVIIGICGVIVGIFKYL